MFESSRLKAPNQKIINDTGIFKTSLGKIGLTYLMALYSCYTGMYLERSSIQDS